MALRAAAERVRVVESKALRAGLPPATMRTTTDPVMHAYDEATLRSSCGLQVSPIDIDWSVVPAHKACVACAAAVGAAGV